MAATRSQRNLKLFWWVFVASQLSTSVDNSSCEIQRQNRWMFPPTQGSTHYQIHRYRWSVVKTSPAPTGIGLFPSTLSPFSLGPVFFLVPHRHTYIHTYIHEDWTNGKPLLTLVGPCGYGTYVFRLRKQKECYVLLRQVWTTRLWFICIAIAVSTISAIVAATGIKMTGGSFYIGKFRRVWWWCAHLYGYNRCERHDRHSEALVVPRMLEVGRLMIDVIVGLSIKLVSL